MKAIFSWELNNCIELLQKPATSFAPSAPPCVTQPMPQVPLYYSPAPTTAAPYPTPAPAAPYAPPAYPAPSPYSSYTPKLAGYPPSPYSAPPPAAYPPHPYPPTSAYPPPPYPPPPQTSSYYPPGNFCLGAYFLLLIFNSSLVLCTFGAPSLFNKFLFDLSKKNI